MLLSWRSTPWVNDLLQAVGMSAEPSNDLRTQVTELIEVLGHQSEELRDVVATAEAWLDGTRNQARVKRKSPPATLRRRLRSHEANERGKPAMMVAAKIGNVPHREACCQSSSFLSLAPRRMANLPNFAVI